ncbi:unnamed protein product [Symbiodinium microadriaticum]|nr:unnamed protein product [Symbiodinium sp. KB8]CAE7308378.1 unnamed protein product [Symbiodinium microadriaticum]
MKCQHLGPKQQARFLTLTAMAGIQFPANEKGDRSTTSFNKSVYAAMAAALASAQGKDLEQKIKSEKDWRHQYHVHLDALIERTLRIQDGTALQDVLKTGLEKARAMQFECADGKYVALSAAMAAPSVKFQTVTVQGDGAPTERFFLPYGGRHLSGEELDSQCDKWADYGTMEPDCAAAIKVGARQLGSLAGRTFLVLGAGSELGPVRPLLQAGATVAAVATRRPKRWADLIAFARKSAGKLLIPVLGNQPANDEDLAAVAGADLLAEAPAVVDWMRRVAKEAPGKVTLGTYLYADGEANVRLTVAADYAVDALKPLGTDKVSFAYLASCGTSTAIPAEAVQAQEQIFQTSSQWAKMFGKRQNISDLGGSRAFLSAFEVLQGPNYALAQMMRQWRAALLHAEGFVVSSPMAPMCRTESVVHNTTMAVLLEGLAYWAPLESYDAETGRMAMFALLISDLQEEPPTLASPLHIVTRKSFHSGIWRAPFAMASLGKSTWFLGKVAPKRTAN